MQGMIKIEDNFGYLGGGAFLSNSSLGGMRRFDPLGKNSFQPEINGNSADRGA